MFNGKSAFREVYAFALEIQGLTDAAAQMEKDPDKQSIP